MPSTKTASKTKTKTKTHAKTAAGNVSVAGLAAISAEQYDSQKEKLAGQERTAQLQLQEKKIEGVLIKGREQDVKNLALSDRVTHAESVRGVQAQTMQQKLLAEQRVLDFTKNETRLKGEILGVQEQRLEARLGHAKTLGGIEDSLFKAQVQAAKNRVENFIASSQQEAAQLGGYDYDA